MDEDRVAEKKTSGQGEIIEINEEKIQRRLDEMVRFRVEVTLNGMLQIEAEQMIGAAGYDCTEGRQNTRVGHYERKLDTKQAG